MRNDRRALKPLKGMAVSDALFGSRISLLIKELRYER